MTGGSGRQSQLLPEPEPELLYLIPHKEGRWSSRDVHCVEFDAETQTITFRAGSFGSFGLYVDKYVHFPYKNWEIRPHDENKVELKLETQFARVRLEVSEDGFEVGMYVVSKSFSEELKPLIDGVVSLKMLIKVS